MVFDLTDGSGCGKTSARLGQTVYRESLARPRQIVGTANELGLGIAQLDVEIGGAALLALSR
jgi:hypothetical protein